MNYSLDEYQLKAETFVVFNHPYYPAASLMIETAEFIDLFTKPLLRGDDRPSNFQEKAISEAGDILWNLAVLLKRNNIHLSEIEKKAVRHYFITADHYAYYADLMYIAVKLAKKFNKTINCASFSTKSSSIKKTAIMFLSAFISALDENDLTLEEVAKTNIAKLENRKAKGVIKGSGDR